MSKSETSPWKKISRATKYENAWIKVVEHQVLNPAGKAGIYGVVGIKNLAIGMLAIDENDRVCLVKQYRFPFGEWTYEIPEGGGSKEVSVLSTAKRELKEETGLSAKSWERLIEVQISNCITDEIGIIFLATDLQQGVACPDEDEAIETIWLPFTDCLKWMDEGKIKDSLTVIALQHLALKRFRQKS